MKLKVVFGAMVMACGLNGPASAFCYEPSFYESAPSPPGTYQRPDVPYCLASYSYSGSHTCSQWELDSYRDDVARYVRKLSDYLDEASTFAQAATNHANEVEAYARCEAQKVNTQHE